MMECGVLWEKLELLGPVFLWGHKFTPLCYTHSDTIFAITYEFLSNVCALFIKCFLRENRKLWPPGSPDLNPHDFY